MSDLARAKRATSAVFAVHGVLLASWAPHIPAVRQRHGLTDAELGAALLAVSAGAVVAMVALARVTVRIGPTAATRLTTVAMAATLPLPVVAPSVPLLIAGLVLFGAALGWMDVAMNAVAAEVEQRAGRPVLSSLHGMFSVGAFAGSLAAAGALALGASPAAHTTVAAVVAALAAWPALRWLAVTDRAAPGDSVGRAGARLERRGRPGSAAALIGVLALVVLLAEGAVLDWSAVLLLDELGAPAALGPLAFAAFSTTMAVGRFAGDAANLRLGPERLFGLGTLVAAIGLAAGVAVGHPAAAIAGFALMGFGMANLVPVLFSAAARAGGTPTEGISTTAALGYLGFLAGPALIGVVAQLASLTTGLLLVAALLTVVATQRRRVGLDRTRIEPSVPGAEITAEAG